MQASDFIAWATSHGKVARFIVLYSGGSLNNVVMIAIGDWTLQGTVCTRDFNAIVSSKLKASWLKAWLHFLPFHTVHSLVASHSLIKAFSISILPLPLTSAPSSHPYTHPPPQLQPCEDFLNRRFIPSLFLVPSP